VILSECTLGQGLYFFIDIIQNVYNGIIELISSFIDFVLNGLLTDGRWDTIPGWTIIFATANMTRPISECVCADADPVWNVVYGIPASPYLPIILDCALNSVMRAVQLPINVIREQAPPDTTSLSEELICTDFAIGDFAEDVFFLLIDMLIGIWDLIDEQVSGMSVASRSVFFARMATMHTMSESNMVIPRVVRDLRMGPDLLGFRALAMMSLSAVDETLYATRGYKQKLFQFDKEIFPSELTDARMQIADSPIVNGSVIMNEFFEAILRIANAPWSRSVTGLVAVAIGGANLTLNVIFHPIDAFATPDGLAYFQFGLMGSYLRMSMDGISQLTAFFGNEWPCVVSKGLQVLTSLPETVAELVMGLIFAWAYPPWTFGVPAPVNCSIVNCSQPPPTGWTIFDPLPDYYAWNGSVLRQDLYFLEEGGECLAFALGCNTSAENNPSQNMTTNCTDAPGACAARSVVRVATAAVNLTLSFIFYLPDLIKFNESEVDFSALPTLNLQLALEDAILCIGLMIDLLDSDGDQCLTSDEPPPRPTSPNVSVVPDEFDPVLDAPPRNYWYCDLTQQAFFWDGRQVMIRNITNPFAFQTSPLTCDIRASRLCAIAIAKSGQVMGSAPEENVTLIAYPAWSAAAGAYPLQLTYNATTGVLVIPLPNSTTLANLYNVTDVIEEDCTHPLPLPDPFGISYACKLGSTPWPAPTPTPTPTPVPVPSPESPSPDASPSDSPMPTPTPTPIPSPSYNQFMKGVISITPSFQWQGAMQWSFGYNNHSNPLECDANLYSGLYCDSGTNQLWIDSELGPRQVFYQTSQPNVPNTDHPIVCDGATYTTPVVCRYNTYSVLQSASPTSLAVGLITYPVYYYVNSSLSKETVSVPCENIPPNDYQCTGGVMVGTNGTFYTDSLLTGTQTFPCNANPLTVAPKCTRVTILYSTGPSVVFDMEGGEVRIYANGTKEPLPCLYGTIPVVPAAAAKVDAALFGTSSAGPPPGSQNATLLSVQQLPARTVLVAAENARIAHENRPYTAEGIHLRRIYNGASAKSDELYRRRDETFTKPLATRETMNALFAQKQSIIEQAATDQRIAATIPRYLRIMALAQNLSIAAIYRKETFICCISEGVTSFLRFHVSWVFDIIYLFQSSLAVIADQSNHFYFPTFAEARDEFRYALCRMACAITKVIPLTLPCNLVKGGCKALDVCGRNAMCDFLDLPILLYDFVISVLTVIRSLIDGVKPEDTFLGSDCSDQNPGGCIISFLVYVVTHSLKTITMVFRTVSTVGDCFLCLITSFGNPDLTCITPFYSVVDAIADAIDGFGIELITLVLNLVVGIIEVIVYLFSGQFKQLWNAIETKILGAIKIFFVNIGRIIWNFLRSLPVVGEIIGFLIDLVSGACNFINDLLDLVGADPLPCPSDEAGKKRDVNSAEQDPNAPGWSHVSPYLIQLWNTEAHGSCGVRISVLNNTGWSSVLETVELTREVLFCHSAPFWIGVNASMTDNGLDDAIFGNECDEIMPDLYHGSTTWPNIAKTVRTKALSCIKNRLGVERARRNNNTWIPVDLFDNPLSWVKLGDDAFLALSVWSQYQRDRSIPAGQLMSSAYKQSVQQQGFSAAHLDTLATTAVTVGDVQNALDAETGPLSIDGYVERAIAANPFSDLGEHTRTYKKERISGIIKSLWQPIFDENETRTGRQSLMTHLSTGMSDFFEQQLQARTTSFPMTTDFPSRLFSANDDRLLDHTITGMVDAVAFDIPGIVLRFSRLVSNKSAEDAELTRKRALLGEIVLSTPAYFWAAMQGVFGIARDFIHGTARKNYEWLHRPETQDWLEAEALRGHNHVNPLQTKGVWKYDPEKASMVTQGISGLIGSITGMFLPKVRGTSGFVKVMQAAMNMPRVRERHAKLSAMFARALLVGSDGAIRGVRNNMRRALTVQSHTEYFHYRATEVNNATGKECLFSIVNASNVTIYPLCQSCFVLDQTLGRTVRAFVTVLTFYGMQPDDCPNATNPLCDPTRYGTLNYSITAYNNFSFFVNDSFTPAIVGDSPELPVGYPWQHYNNWRWFRDPTPNKTGWGDLGDLINATWVFILQAIGVSDTSLTETVSASDLWTTPIHSRYAKMRNTIQSNFDAIAGHYSWFPVKTFYTQILTMFGVITPAKSTPVYNIGVNHTNNGNTSIKRATLDQIPPGPYESWAEVIRAWIDFIWGLRTCDYYRELNGAGKRFSLGETLVGGLMAVVVVSFVLMVVTGGDFFLSIFGGGGIVAFYMFIGWLIITYDYSLRCFYALPVGLADDAMYMIGFSIFPRCLIIYGVVNEEFYDNSNCYQCEAWNNEVWTVPNFAKPLSKGGKFGFSDIRYNIAFFLRAMLPGVYNELKPGSNFSKMIPGANVILKNWFFRGPLDAFADWEPMSVTPTAFRQFWHGGTWVTGISNYFIAQALISIVLGVFGPFLMQLLALALAVILLLIPMLLFICNGIYLVSCFERPYMPTSQPDSKELAKLRKKEHKTEEERRQRRRENDVEEKLRRRQVGMEARPVAWGYPSSHLVKDTEIELDSF
jgi:hypothetical protein